MQTVPGIHLIIQSGTSSANLAPIKIGNTLIVQTAKQGKYLGWMEINWLANREWKDDTLKNELALKKRELAAVSRKEKLSPKAAGPQGTKSNDANADQILTAEKVRLINEIQRLEAAIIQQNREHPTSTYTNHFVALDTVLPDNPQVLAIVEETKQRVKALGNK